MLFGDSLRSVATMSSDTDSRQRVSRDSPEWERAREQALKRDQYRCQHCRKTAAHRWNLDFQVHHIRPVAKGGTHDLENLATLCNNCHRQLHRHHDDKDELPPDLIRNDRPTFGLGVPRIDLSELGPCCEAIVGVLQENGPTQLKDIAGSVDYAKTTVNSNIHRLKSLNYVARIKRGVYGYITTIQYRKALAREPDNQNRRDVDVYRPGTQVELTKFSNPSSAEA